MVRWKYKSFQTLQGTKNLNSLGHYKNYYQKHKAENPNYLKEVVYKENKLEKQNEWRRKNPAHMLFYRARERCNKSGLEFNLVETDIVIPSHCPLLGIELIKDGTRDSAPSLDRIDNSKGYTKDNVWVISFKANRMKNTASIEELIMFSKNILKEFD